MKRVASLITLALAFAACEAPTALDDSVTQSVSAVASAAAETFTESFSIPIPFGFFVPCAAGGAGEEVVGGGNLHVLTHMTTNGNRFTIKQQNNPQGITGTGLTTGDTYRAVGATQVTFGQSFVNGQSTNTFTDNFRIIGPGPGNNFLVHVTFHMTVNANGVVTTELENVSVDCK